MGSTSKKFLSYETRCLHTEYCFCHWKAGTIVTSCWFPCPFYFQMKSGGWGGSQRKPIRGCMLFQRSLISLNFSPTNDTQLGKTQLANTTWTGSCKDNVMSFLGVVRIQRQLNQLVAWMSAFVFVCKADELGYLLNDYNYPSPAHPLLEAMHALDWTTENQLCQMLFSPICHGKYTNMLKFQIYNNQRYKIIWQVFLNNNHYSARFFYYSKRCESWFTVTVDCSCFCLYVQ